jgi:hypothetical protein
MGSAHVHLSQVTQQGWLGYFDPTTQTDVYLSVNDVDVVYELEHDETGVRAYAQESVSWDVLVDSAGYLLNEHLDVPVSIQTEYDDSDPTECESYTGSVDGIDLNITGQSCDLSSSSAWDVTGDVQIGSIE